MEVSGTVSLDGAPWPGISMDFWGPIADSYFGQGQSVASTVTGADGSYTLSAEIWAATDYCQVSYLKVQNYAATGPKLESSELDIAEPPSAAFTGAGAAILGLECGAVVKGLDFSFISRN